ncbi:MAG TPA: DUF2185 domain-containing protein [Stellaceae bacterium]|nr:DUF2185 domain-containing protein [Stellaceae bacterium]
MGARRPRLVASCDLGDYRGRLQPTGLSREGRNISPGSFWQVYNRPNHSIYAVNTIANCDPSIIPLLDAPEGSAFERTSESSRFAPVEDWDPPE